MVIIGVTGTSGKSTVIELIGSILESAGFTVGLASTIRFKAGTRQWLNRTKMTMVGRFQLQKLLAEMVAAGCQYAVIETSSQGIEQFRHVGIHYDVAVLTNLYPEHLDAHKGFENYKEAKRKLFRQLERQQPKTIRGKTIPRTIVVNLDCPYAPEFLGLAVEQKFGYTTTARYDITGVTEVRAQVAQEGGRVGLFVDGCVIGLQLLGEHNAVNALCAYSVGKTLNVAPDVMRRALSSVTGIPGRIEFVRAGQSFTVIVDYAFEPVAMEKLYQTVSAIPHQKILHVLGTTGGGRDRARGAVLGEMVGRAANVVVVTDEDPYDDDPRMLMERVITGVEHVGKVLEKNLFMQPDRRAAIRLAVTLAQPNDLVLITGKGCEQAIVAKHGVKIPWDDRMVAREEINSLTSVR